MQGINFISVGFDIYGTPYSTAKIQVKNSNMEKEDRPWKNAFLVEKRDISFDGDDNENVLDPQHDGLVIKLYVANHFIRRILVDGGSSINIILLETLKRWTSHIMK